MTEKPIIAVLEDMEVRVEWLRGRFPDAEIVWAKSVDEFRDVLKTIDRSRLILFLLDHDLGGPYMGSLDPEGKTGLDAARDLCQGCWSDIPAIIWSINGKGATNMVQTLQDDGFVAAWIPFHRSLLSKLEAAIRSQVTP